MPNEHDTTVSDDRPADSRPTNSSSTEPGPSLLTERPLSAIFVHLLGLLTGIVGPGLVYLLSSHEFTRENARNALNWQLFLTAAFLVEVVVLLGFIGITELLPIPDPIALVGFLLVFASMVALTILAFLDFVFPVVGTAKAVLGATWAYPIAPEFL